MNLWQWAVLIIFLIGLFVVVKALLANLMIPLSLAAVVVVGYLIYKSVARQKEPPKP
jgi:uncharacterized membrane protein